MTNKNDYSPLPSYAEKLVRNYARKLSNVPILHALEREDLEQELTLRLLVKLPAYNESRGALEPFLYTVTQQIISDLFIFANKATRPYAPISYCLNQLLLCGNYQSYYPTPRYDLQLDLKQILKQLPTPTMQLCLGLAEYSVTELSQTTGKSRPALYRSIAKIKRQFEQYELNFYLTTPDTS